jgi:hypothetical protein
MSPDEIHELVRIYAVEIMVVNQFAMFCLTASPTDPQGILRSIREQMIEGARRRGFPELDAASSDFASAELEEAVGRLMEWPPRK